jgi:hypothetical protein
MYQWVYTPIKKIIPFSATFFSQPMSNGQNLKTKNL